jgi:hypothetical protein
MRKLTPGERDWLDVALRIWAQRRYNHADEDPIPTEQDRTCFEESLDEAAAFLLDLAEHPVKTTTPSGESAQMSFAPGVGFVMTGGPIEEE